MILNRKILKNFFIDQIDRPDFGLSEKFTLQGFDHARVKQYYNFMVDVAVIYGANRSFAEREMHDVLEFKTNLAKVIVLTIINYIN